MNFLLDIWPIIGIGFIVAAFVFIIIKVFKKTPKDPIVSSTPVDPAARDILIASDPQRRWYQRR